MLHTIQKLDTQFFIFLNSFHWPWLDVVMHYITAKNTWIPLYILLIVFLFWKHRNIALKIVIALIITIIVTDQFTSSFLKPFVQRLRPCYVGYLQGQVHLVDGCGGTYGFASSHAANSFGLAMMLWLVFHKKYKWTSLWFVWAAAVAYSRIYVGVHYPLDVFCGAGIGLLAATSVYHFLKNKLTF